MVREEYNALCRMYSSTKYVQGCFVVQYCNMLKYRLTIARLSLTKISQVRNLNRIHDFKGELQHFKNAEKKNSMCTRAKYYSTARSDRSRSPAVPSIMHRLWRHRPERQP